MDFMINVIIYITIGICLGAYLFNNNIRNKVNNLIKRISVGLFLLLQDLMGSKKQKRGAKTNGKKAKQPKVESDGPKIKQTQVKNTYACTCGEILEPITEGTYKGFYFCNKCKQVKDVKVK